MAQKLLSQKKSPSGEQESIKDRLLLVREKLAYFAHNIVDLRENTRIARKDRKFYEIRFTDCLSEILEQVTSVEKMLGIEH